MAQNLAAPTRPPSSWRPTMPGGLPEPPRGTAGGMGSGYVRVRAKQPDGSYKIVRVHSSKLTPQQLAAARKNGLNTAAGSKPTPEAITTPPKTPKPPAIDPRDGQYQRESAQFAFDRDNAVNAAEAERQRLPALYNRGLADIRTGYNRDRYDSNAELASRGIIRSGEYQRRGADRLIQQANQTSALDQQYGSGAQAGIAARLAQIQQQYSLNQANALLAAKERYQQMYPASSYIGAES